MVAGKAVKEGAEILIKRSDALAKKLRGKNKKLPFVHNTEKNPFKKSQGKWAMDKEPAGQFITPLDRLRDVDEPLISGVKEFKNPLYIDFGGGYDEPDNWKRVLSESYGGKTGKKLTDALRADGYDAVISVDPKGNLSESVDLFKGKGGVDMASLILMGAGGASLLTASDETEAGPAGQFIKKGGKKLVKIKGTKQAIEFPAEMSDDQIKRLLSGAAGAALGLSALTASDKSEGAFLGQAAKTANKRALKIAQRMAAKGKSPERVWKDTGWFQGADNKWRFEVDDRGLSYRTKDIRTLSVNDHSVPSGDVFQHNALYENYPELAGVDLTVSGKGGAYSSGGPDPLMPSAYDPPRIRVGADPTTAGSTYVHELQHGIQDIEGFARGGDIRSMVTEFDYSKISEPLAEFHALATIAGAPDDVLLRQPSDLSMVSDIGQYIDDVLDSLDINDATDAGAKLSNKLEAAGGTLLRAFDSASMPPEIRYKRLAGEVEARNVQTRIDMTPEERIANPPWTTEDVARASQIVSFRGGASPEALGMLSLGGLSVAGIPLLTPKQAKALERYEDNGSITADEYPTLEWIGNQLLKPDLPIMGKPFEGLGRYLIHFGEPKTNLNRAGLSIGAALDTI